MEELQKEIERIRREQEELVFAAFDEETAWETGKRLRQTALENGYAVAISVTLNRRRLFACAMAGTTPINDEWIRRKENTVYKFFKSSYEMSLYMKLKGDSIGPRYGLEDGLYAAAGGAVPVCVKGAGIVGTVTVSGLAEHEDHALVVSVLREMIAEETAGGRE